MMPIAELTICRAVAGLSLSRAHRLPRAAGRLAPDLRPPTTTPTTSMRLSSLRSATPPRPSILSVDSRTFRFITNALNPPNPRLRSLLASPPPSSPPESVRQFSNPLSRLLPTPPLPITNPASTVARFAPRSLRMSHSRSLSLPQLQPANLRSCSTRIAPPDSS